MSAFLFEEIRDGQTLTAYTFRWIFSIKSIAGLFDYMQVQK